MKKHRKNSTKKRQNPDDSTELDLYGMNANTGARGKRVSAGKKRKTGSLHPPGVPQSGGFSDPIVDDDK